MQQENLTLNKATCPEDQCEAMLRTGQCTQVKIKGCNYCLAHGGTATLKKQEEQALNNYRLNKFQARLREMRSSSVIKDLRDEIAILRMMLEEKLNGFQGSTDMLLQSGQIGDIIMKIERLVISCHKLDEKTGCVVDRSTVINMAEQLVSVITKNVQHLENGGEALERISIAFEKIMKETGAMP